MMNESKTLSSVRMLMKGMVYFARLTINLLLTEISVHMKYIFLKFNVHGAHCVRFIRLEHQKIYFLVWISLSVNKGIIIVYYNKGIIIVYYISVSIFPTLDRLFFRHLNLATLANFWKSLNLSGAKIKISLFFSFFDQTGEWQKIKRITTKHRSILR